MLNNIDLNEVIAIAKDAGNVIMSIYEKDFEVEYKEDASPLTVADTESNELICSRLQELYPSIPIISEENKEVKYSVRKNWEYYWCIDPIDGTKEFVKKNGEFTVNIALIHNDTPVLGVVYAPALNDMYSAKEGFGAFKNSQKLPLNVNENIENNITIVASKSHLTDETKEYIEELANGIENQIFISKGSSLKLCMVAEGKADIYPRLAPTTEWDTAAADAIVRESGKMTYIYGQENKRVVYNKENLLNPWFVVR